ncbi:MAG: phosphoribosyl-AMP cyclohydrolase [Halioglobus sp.]
MPVTAKSDHRRSSKKAFFLTLEQCKRGDTRLLSEVLSKLTFNDMGLIPAVAQDVKTGEVLMLAWMNETALERTLDTGKMTYFSRSRNELWIKGQTSGNFQKLVDIRIDCDGDSLLCIVDQHGGACHTNRKSCFYLSANSANGTVRVIN